MKQMIKARNFVNCALLLSSLLLLSACNPFKKDGGCEGCGVGHGDGKQGGEVLVKIKGQPAVDVQCYADYWEDFVKSDPRIEQVLPFHPTIRHEVCKQLVNEKVIQEWIKDKKLDQSADYQKKLKKAREVTERLVALQAFNEDVLKNIDQSEAALEKYYNENRDKNPMMQNAPFAKTPESTKAQQVTFSDEKSAKDFLAKAQKAPQDFATLAKAAKKDVKDLGSVNDQSRNVDFGIKAKLKNLASGQVDLAQAGKNQFVVIKAVAKTPATYASFAEVKDYVKELMTRDLYEKAITGRLSELKKEYKVEEEPAEAYFKKESEEKQAQMQEKLKAMQQAQQGAQAAQPEGQSAAAPAAATPAENAPKAA